MTGAPILKWTAKRKEALVVSLRNASPQQRAAVLAGHGISEAEFAGWGRKFAAHGRKGLATTKTQETRA